MPNRDTMVIGASAGGVQALSTLVAQFHPNLPAAVFIVLHTPAEFPSLLRRRAQEAEEHSAVLRQLLLSEQKGDIADEVVQTGGS